jgi:hypothetical protein
MVRRALRLLIVLAAMPTACAVATKAPPVANAGPDVTVRVGRSASLDGSRSLDLDGGVITYYQWRIVAAPEARGDQVGLVMREGVEAAIWTSDRPMEEQDLGEWIVELKVTDDEGQSATDDLTLTVIP